MTDEVSQKTNDKCSVHAIVPPNIEPDQKHRFEAVRSAIKHAWDGYNGVILTPYRKSFKKFFGILPADDLMPLTSDGITWLHSGATLYDALDTLYIAGLKEEYEEALELTLSLPLPLHPTKIFEYSIRVLGSLLGAYSVTGDVRLLDRAVFTADSIIDGGFRSSPTALPRPFDVLAPLRSSVSFLNIGGMIMQRLYTSIYRLGRDYMKQHRVNSLAGFGSFSLEFAYLSKLTGNSKYKDASDAIFQHVQNHIGHGQVVGVIPSIWNVMKGLPSTQMSGLGGGSDSYYEYLIKNAILLQPLAEKIDIEMLESYIRTLDESFNGDHIGITFDENNVAYPTEGGSDYNHLLCFVPGMLAVGEKFYDEPLDFKYEKGDTLSLAKMLLDGCWTDYQSTPTKLGNEKAWISNEGKKNSDDPSFLLRPEYIESLFILYRITKDDIYRERAWDAFQMIEKYCKFSQGYTSLRNVFSTKGNRRRKDEMPSYFLGETLKYLLLIFSPDDYIDLHEFVFTTEAHPLRQIRTMEYTSSGDCDYATTTNQPTVLSLNLMFFVIVYCIFILARMNNPFSKKRRGDRKKNQ